MTENNGTANGGKVSQNKGVVANGTNQLAGGEQPQRRLIKADLDLLYSFDSKDDDDDEEECLPADSGKENGDCFFGHICPEGTQSTPVTPWKQPSEPKFEDDESTKPRIDTRRRHSICNPTNRDEHGSTLITFPFEYTNSVNVFSSLQCPRASPMLHRRKAKLPHSVSKSCLQEEFFQSNHWQTAIECLSLNLEEVVHIRNVLTKAELESLPVDCSLKEDVEKGKVCFLCLKTRFSLFLGPWGNVCKLCKRTVCAKCCEKMRIPTEHFAKVPVSTLSPNISPRDEEKDLPGSRNSTVSSLSHSNSANLPRKNSVGSAPTSPNLPRKADSGSSSINSDQRSTSPGHNENEERDKFPSFHGHGPHSLPTVTSISLGLMAFKRRGFGRSKEADKTEKLKGSLMVVCHDCKVMVLQIIRSSRAKKASAAVRGGMTLTFVNPLKS